MLHDARGEDAEGEGWLYTFHTDKTNFQPVKIMFFLLISGPKFSVNIFFYLNFSSDETCFRFISFSPINNAFQ